MTRFKIIRPRNSLYEKAPRCVTIATISSNYTSGEAAILAILAGMDMILMPADATSAVEAVCDAVESGRIPQERIEESVMRILSEKEEMGLLPAAAGTEGQ